MKFRSTRSRHVFGRAKLVALVAASFVVAVPFVAAPSAAMAQGLFDRFEVSPRQVARSIEDAGYEIRGPMIRRGDVYVCDAVSEHGRPVRLVVDAHNGQVIERFAERRPAWDERDDSDAPPLPPRGINGAPHRPVTHNDDEDAPDRVARGSVWDASPQNYGGATVIPGIGKPAPDSPEILEPVKPRPHLAKRHPAAPPVATAKVTPDIANTAPSSTDTAAPVSTPAEPPKPAAPAVAAVAPSAPAHVAPQIAPVVPEIHKSAPEPAKPAVDSAKPTDPKPVAEAKPIVEIKPIAAPKAVPEAKSASHSEKKLNDLPVSPLD